MKNTCCNVSPRPLSTSGNRDQASHGPDSVGGTENARTSEWHRRAWSISITKIEAQVIVLAEQAIEILFRRLSQLLAGVKLLPLGQLMQLTR